MSDINDLVIDNISLVYHVLRKTGFYNQLDEYEDIAYIGLVKGVNTFDDSKNIKLSTYLCKCIQNEIFNYYRKIHTKKRDNGMSTYSLSKVIYSNDGEDIRLEDTISSDENIYEIISDKLVLDSILEDIDSLKDEHKTIINLFYGLNGYDKHAQTEIAYMINKSQAQVSRIISRFINKMKEKYKVGV